VHQLELTGLAAVTAPLGQHFPVVPIDCDDLAVRAVRNEYKFLGGVFRQHKIPNGTILQSFRLDPELLVIKAMIAPIVALTGAASTQSKEFITAMPDSSWLLRP
jgi:hypothetical protein